MNLKRNWWKILAIVLLFYTVIGGFLLQVPRLPILNESIRNLYFHVPMWFGMIIMLGTSVFFSIRYLSTNDLRFDRQAVEFANTGIVFGVLGILTGMIWASFTWGAPWSNDPKQNAAAIGLLIYFAFLVLRNSLDDEQLRARISSIYNIFAFPVLVTLLFILPRMTDSLHPGAGGNPGFNAYDLDNNMRMVFYPAVIGWTLLGVWFTSLRIRIKNLEATTEDIN
jgi:heme exporter protein C